MGIFALYEHTFKTLPKHRREVYRDIVITRPAQEERSRNFIITMVIYADYPRERLAVKAEVTHHQIEMCMTSDLLQKRILDELCHKMEAQIERMDDKPELLR